MSHSTRRALLASLGLCAVGGCTALTDSGERHSGTDSEPQGTAGLPTRLWLEQVALSEADRDAVDPIVFQRLSESERSIVQRALETDAYTVPTDEESAALESLRDRIEARTENGSTLTVYLERNETYYRIGFAAGDHIIAHPDH